jgi:hypothetical protein
MVACAVVSPRSLPILKLTTRAAPATSVACRDGVGLIIYGWATPRAHLRLAAGVSMMAPAAAWQPAASADLRSTGR